MEQTAFVDGTQRSLFGNLLALNVSSLPTNAHLAFIEEKAAAIFSQLLCMHEVGLACTHVLHLG